MFNIYNDIPKDPFDVLQVVPSFDLDGDNLRAAYIKTQQLVHPDKFVSIEDKKKASHWSEAVNQSYNTLQSPILRAKALYERLTRQPMPEVANDPQLLEMMMELRESGANKAQLVEIVGGCLVQMSEAFRVRKLDQVPNLVNRLIYLNRLIEEAN